MCIRDSYGNAKSAQEKWTTFVHQNLEYLGGDPQMFKMALEAGTDPQKQAEVSWYISQQQTTNQKVKNASALVALKHAQGELTSDEAVAGYNTAATATVAQVMNAFRAQATGFQGQNWQGLLKGLNDLTSEASATGAPDARKRQQLALEFGKLHDAVQFALNDLSTKPLMDPQGNPMTDVNGRAISYSTLIKDPTKIAQTKELVSNSLKVIAKNLGEGSMVLASTAAEALKGLHEGGATQVMASKELQMIAAVTTAIPNQSAAQVLNTLLTQQNWKPLSNAAQDLLKFHAIKMTVEGAKEGGIENFPKDHREQTRQNPQAGATVGSNTNGDPPPAANREVINTVRSLVTNPTLDTKSKVNVLNYISTPNSVNFFTEFKPNEQFDAWARLYSPQVMAEAKKTNPETWDLS